MGADTADTNIQIIRRDGTTAAKTDTGVSKTTANSVWDFSAFCAPNDSKITVRFVNVATGAAAVDNVELTTNLPGNTTFLNAHAQILSVTGIVAKELHLNRIYVESDT